MSYSAINTPLPVGEGLGAGVPPSQKSAPALATVFGNFRIFVAISQALPGLTIGRQCQFFGNGLHNATRVRQNINVPEADHMVSVTLDYSRSHLVAYADGVLSAVNFDCQPGRTTGEIDNIRSDWMLSGKVNPQLVSFQSRPQPFFGVRRVCPQLARNPRHALRHHRSYTPSQPSPSRGRACMAD